MNPKNAEMQIKGHYKKQKKDIPSAATIYPKRMTSPSSSKVPTPNKKIGSAQNMLVKGIGKGRERNKPRIAMNKP